MENIRGILSVISLAGLLGGPILWLAALNQRKTDDAIFKLISPHRVRAVKNHLHQKGVSLYYMACIVFATGIISGLILYLILPIINPHG